MKTIQITLTEEQLEAIKKTGILDEKKGLWRPKIGEKFWYLAGSGINCPTYGQSVDESVLARQEVYKTPGEAIAADEWRIARMNILRWKAENCPFEEDWGDNNQAKWFPCYDWGRTEFLVDNNHVAQLLPMGGVYFATAKDTEACLKACKADWYTYFGVKR